MADRRKRNAAKQARRDAKRRKARDGRATEQAPEAPLIDEVREALDGGRPIDLLGLVSMIVEATSERAALLRRSGEEPPHLDALVTAFGDVPGPETTALLAALGELAGDDVLRDRCRREVAARGDGLPPWLAALAQTSIPRAVRMTHVLGDGDELLLAVRLADGQELTCAVHVDHLEMSTIKDAFVVPGTIDTVVGVAQASNDDPDTTFGDVDPADARAQLEHAFARPLAMFPLETDTWPACRPLVRWLTRLMPTGGSHQPVSQRDWEQTEDLIPRFLASPAGRPFDDRHRRELLELCCEEGTGDPLRWSADRLRELLHAPVVDPGEVPLEPLLDVPELLSAFVAFAHAESGIRQELTADALAAIEDATDDYRAAVFEAVTDLESLDDDEEQDTV